MIKIIKLGQVTVYQDNATLILMSSCCNDLVVPRWEGGWSCMKCSEPLHQLDSLYNNIFSVDIPSADLAARLASWLKKVCPTETLDIQLTYP